jgi:hypothetical protein
MNDALPDEIRESADVWPQTPTQKAAFDRAVEALKNYSGDAYHEGLKGYEAVAKYFNKLGFTTARGRPIRGNTVRAWMRKRGLKHYTCGGAYRNKVMTTAVWVQAWLVSIEYRRRDTSLRRAPKGCLCCCCKHEPANS